MGKNLISQKRGKGTSRYLAPSFRYAGRCSYGRHEPSTFTIKEIIHSTGHDAPLAVIEYSDGKSALVPAASGVKKGDTFQMMTTEVKVGNVMLLQDIPPGTEIFNIELVPGDGGKLVRGAGGVARVLGKVEEGVIVQLPSKNEKILNGNCLATIGTAAGSGKNAKPFLKAGKRYHKMHARNKRYPRIHGVSMNAVQHPFGGSSSHHKGRPTIAPKNAPPGRKVGKIRPSRTGRRK